MEKTCLTCNKSFSDPKHPRRKYCSRNCANQRLIKEEMRKRPCAICGTVYKPHRSSQKYCSRICFGKAIAYADPICEVCKKPFHYRSSGANRFCSYECARIGAKTGFHKNCKYCGKPFWVVPSKAAKRYYCSQKCKSDNHHRLLICEICRKTIKVRAHIIESGKYTGRFCSYECAAQWQKGENHSNWQGGYEKWRGPNWKKQKNKARKRDDYACQQCGINENELGRPLDIHHIKPWRIFNDDWNKANQLKNLLSLCPKCHTTFERRNHTNQ